MTKSMMMRVGNKYICALKNTSCFNLDTIFTNSCYEYLSSAKHLLQDFNKLFLQKIIDIKNSAPSHTSPRNGFSFEQECETIKFSNT